MTETQASDDDRSALDLLIRGFQLSRMIRLVADLAIADKIPSDGSCDVAELAAACAVLPVLLLRVLRALAAFGIFRLTAEGSVAHSPRSLLLRTDAANSLHHAARFWTAPGSWNAWGALDVALTGGIPHQAAWNTSRFSTCASILTRPGYSMRSWRTSLTTGTTRSPPRTTSPAPR